MKSIFSEDHKKTIAKIRKARINEGLSQRDLADKLGVSQSYVSKMEQGQARLDIVQLKNIASALKISLEDIIS